MAGIGSSIRLRVTPEVLEGKANEVTGLVNTISNNFQIISNIIQRTGGYWLGEAGDKHRQLYNDKRDEIETMMRRLMEHPKDLLVMAGIYKETEGINLTISQALPGNVIS